MSVVVRHLRIVGSGEKVHRRLGARVGYGSWQVGVREPLNDLTTDWTPRGTWRDPRAALIHHLRDDPVTAGRYLARSNGDWPALPNLLSPPTALRHQLAAGERPPIDPDAT